MRTGDFVVLFFCKMHEQRIFPARQLTVVASLSLHWSVPPCFVKEHRSSANLPATCPFPIGLFFWKLPAPAWMGTTCRLEAIAIIVG